MLAAGVLLLALPWARFWTLWHPDPAQRQAFAAGDFVDQHVLMRSFVAAELGQGRLPAWGPYTYSGKPALADSLFSTLYPLSFWQALIPQPPAGSAPPGPAPLRLGLQAEALAHLGLAAVFMALFIRQVTGHGLAAVLAGAAFGLGGYLTGYALLQIIILQSAIWLPAGLWLIELALERRSLTLAAAAGGALGLSVLAGHIQTTTFVAYTTAAYLVFRALQLRVGWRFFVLAPLAWGVGALALSAGQWLPSIQLHQLSPRARISYFEASFGFQVVDLLGLLRPDPGGYWSPLYIGVVPLLGAAFALGRVRRAEVAFWGLFALITLLLSLGRNGPLYPLVYNLAPDLQFFRAQERTAFPAAFALTVLGGYGLAWALARQPRARWLAALALAVMFFDLARLHTHPGQLLTPAAPDLTATPITQRLLAEPEPASWRVSSEGRLPGGGNAGLYWHLRDVTGNTPLFIGLYEFMLQTVPEVRWWQLLNVRYVVTQRQLDFPGVTLALEDPARDERLYGLALGGAPVWITHAAEVAPDQTSAIWRTSEMETLDPLTTAVLEQPADPAPAPPPAGAAEEVRLTSFAAQTLTAEATLASPGVVVFSEIAYPGWVVTVNGQPAPALRAFGLLRAVAVPAGRHVIAWRFESAPVAVGGLISLATGLMLVIFLTRTIGSRPPPTHSAR